MTVTEQQIQAAQNYLINVPALAAACDRYGLPFYVACTILDKETDGRNIYGHDRGGAMSGPSSLNVEVTEANYRQFRKLIDAGKTSNGVGPMQITWKGYFPDMEKQGLKPWIPADNILYGVSILARTWQSSRGSVYAVGKAYNGNASYGTSAAALALVWKRRVGTADLAPASAPAPAVPLPAGVKHSAYGDYVRWGQVAGKGGGWVTPVDAEILAAVEVAGMDDWGPIRLSQGGLSSSEPKSAKTHVGLGAWDIAIDGRDKNRVWRLAARLLRSGVVAFPRGYGDGMTPQHIHCVSWESLSHTHAEAHAQLDALSFGYLHKIAGKRGAGLAGARWRRYIGPDNAVEHWETSPYRPENVTEDTATYTVTAEPSLLGLNVDRQQVTSRKTGATITATKQVRRWGRQNIVTAEGDYYALDYLTPLTKENEDG